MPCGRRSVVLVALRASAEPFTQAPERTVGFILFLLGWCRRLRRPVWLLGEIAGRGLNCFILLRFWEAFRRVLNLLSSDSDLSINKFAGKGLTFERWNKLQADFDFVAFAFIWRADKKPESPLELLRACLDFSFRDPMPKRLICRSTGRCKACTWAASESHGLCGRVLGGLKDPELCFRGSSC